MDIDQLPDAPAFATSRGVKGNSFIPTVKRAKGNGNGDGNGASNRRGIMDSVGEEGDAGNLPSPGSNVLPQFKPRPTPAPLAPPPPPAAPAPAAAPAAPAPASAPAPAAAAEASSSNGGWRTAADNGWADDSRAPPATSYPSHLAEEDEEEVNQR